MDAAFPQGRISRQVDFPPAAVPSGRQTPVHGRALGGVRLASAGDDRLCWNDRIFTPLVTLWVFLGQVLSADQSCRAAVARLIAHRVAQGLRAVQFGDGSLLPGEEAPAGTVLLRRGLPGGAKPGCASRAQWLWKGRRVYLFDGSTVSMPDTAENREEYPLTYNQKPGTGFPVARIGAIISLSCGAILNLGICRYAGKGPKRGRAAAQAVGRVAPRRRPGGGSLDVCLDRDGDAPAARRRLRLSPDIAPHGRFSPWNPSRQR